MSHGISAMNDASANLLPCPVEEERSESRRLSCGTIHPALPAPVPREDREFGPPEDRDETAAWRRQFFAPQTVAMSVCIVNWNCRELLRQCLSSLYNQPQDAAFETIVVDNGSSDDAPIMLAEEFPQVQVIRNAENLGFSRANNQAARRASGQYLFFLNNDTQLPAGTLGRLVNFLDAHAEIGMVGPRLRDPRQRVQVSFRPRPCVWSLLHRTLLLRWSGLCRKAHRSFRRGSVEDAAPRSVEVLMGAALAISKRRFEAVGGWDEDFEFGGEDMELCHRVRQAAPVVYLPDVEITHFGRASTRRNIAFAAPRIAVGFVRCLRKTAAATQGELLLYKAVLTLDGPLQWLVKLGQFALRRLQGKRDKAAKSLLEARAYWHFMRNLHAFWRA